MRALWKIFRLFCFILQHFSPIAQTRRQSIEIPASKTGHNEHPPRSTPLAEGVPRRQQMVGKIPPTKSNR